MKTFNIIKTIVIWGAAMGLLTVAIIKDGHAATVGDLTPKMANGAVAVATAGATAVPPTCMVGQNTFAIFNNGPNTIWCGRTSAVTNVTGFPVCAGCALNVDITCGSNAGAASFYCRADTALQVSPADTRYIQVK